MHASGAKTSYLIMPFGKFVACLSATNKSKANGRSILVGGFHMQTRRELEKRNREKRKKSRWQPTCDHPMRLLGMRDLLSFCFLFLSWQILIHTEPTQTLSLSSMLVKLWQKPMRYPSLGCSKEGVCDLVHCQNQACFVLCHILCL